MTNLTIYEAAPAGFDNSPDSGNTGDGSFLDGVDFDKGTIINTDSLYRSTVDYRGDTYSFGIIISTWSNSIKTLSYAINGQTIVSFSNLSLSSDLFFLYEGDALTEKIFEDADTILGSSKNDVFWGYDGNDSIFGGGGNDFINGGVGQDTAVYMDTSSNYVITHFENNVAVTSLSSSYNEGVDILNNIEYLEFDGIIQAVPSSNFNALQYIASNSDLIDSIGNDAFAGFNHFINYGVIEGREVTFDVSQYLENYQDVRDSVKGDTQEAIKHYILYGYSEGRTDDSISTLGGTDPVVNALPTGDISILGTAIEGSEFSASNNLADADGLGVIAYQWKENGIDIPEAIGSELIIDGQYIGQTITVVASYTDGGGTLESVSSSPTPIVQIASTDPETTQAAIDRILDWGEAAFSNILPEQNESRDIWGYYARTYSNGNSLGEKDENIYFHDGSDITVVGTVDSLLFLAELGGF